MKTFKPGDRVILLANEEEGWSEERGEFLEYELGYPGMCAVSVDRKYRSHRGDDGLREIEVQYIKLEK